MKVIKDSAIYLMGELVSRAMPFLLLPYLSRKLGVEGFGQLAYYQTYLMLFLIIVSLSQEGAITRYFYHYGKRSLALVIHTGYAYTLFSGAIILLACWYLQSEILAYLAVSAIFQSFLNVQLSVRQCQKQPLPYSVIQFASSVTSVLLTVLLLELYQTELVEKRILAILSSNILVFAGAYLLYAKKQPHKRFAWRDYKVAMSYLFGFGLPLILHNASLFLKGQLDRVFIYHTFSEVELGLYAMGAQITAILIVILQALNKAAIPYFFEHLKQKKITIVQVHKWALLSFFIIPIPAMVAGIIPESMIVWLLGPQFLGTKYYIVMFLFSTALVIPYFILVNYLFFYGQNKYISLCSIISTIIYVITLILFTKYADIEYVPYAGIIGSVSILPILYFMTNKVSKTQ